MANVYKNIQAVVNASGSDVSMYTSPTLQLVLLKQLNYLTHMGVR